MPRSFLMRPAMMLGINADRVCIDLHRLFRQGEAREALIPQFFRYQRIKREFVSFRLDRIAFARAFLIEEVKAQPIEEMQEDVTKLVHQHKPEIIQPVIAQRETDDRVSPSASIAAPSR